MSGERHGRGGARDGGGVPAEGGARERKTSFRASSLEMKPVYTGDDTRGLDEARDLGAPGAPPFTRGVYPTMYRGRLWTMRQYAGFGTADETNRRFRMLLDAGQTGLSVAFDLPTQMGFDSDHTLAAGEVGRAGVAIDSLEDMERLLAGIPLDRVSTSMTINATAALLLAMYQIAAEKTGVAPEKIRGTVQNDPLKEFIARGTYIYPPAASMRITTDIFAYCAESLPSFNTISISGYHIREAGSTAAQELAFTFANAIAYVESAVRRGLDVERFAPRLSFFFNAHNHLLEEVAKFRAARRLWHWIMTERFGARGREAAALRFHAQTGGSTLTAQQPETNIVRVAYQALAAVLGGTQSLHTNSWDEALTLPSEKAALLALRTQQVLASETGVADTADPLAGSFAIEAMTDEIERQATALIARVDEMGGAVRAIEHGFPQEEIARSAYEHQLAVESGDLEVVGVNTHAVEAPPPPAEFRIDPSLEPAQVERLRALRARRDAAPVGRARERIASAARGDANLMPPILEAVRAYATVGEICDALRTVFGEHRPAGAL